MKNIFAWLKARKKNKVNITARPDDFVEYAEIFTLKPVTDQEFYAAVKKADFPSVIGTKISGNTGRMYLESELGFKSRITHKEQTEDKSVYRFEFINWQSKSGKPEHETEMNRQMTMVENMFLDLDPNTRLATEKNDVKTKRTLI